MNKRLIKRAFDIFFVASTLLVMSPLLCLFLLVWLVDRMLIGELGPLLISEPRLTRGQAIFTLYKVNMYSEIARLNYVDNNEKYLKYKTYSFLQEMPDALTPFGRMMKKYYLDELGQVVNVLRGEMSLVGPRPLPDGLFNCDSEPRNILKAGVIGLAATRWKNDDHTEKADARDLYYLNVYRQNSPVAMIWLDLSILFDAIKAVLRGRGM